MKKRTKQTQAGTGQVQNRALTFIDSLNKYVTKNLREAGIETRNVKSNGLWCCTLMPLILVLHKLIYKVSETYTLTTCISIGLMFYCLLFIVFVSVSSLVVKQPEYAGCAASSLVSTLLMYMFLEKGLTTAICLSTASVLSMCTLLRLALIKLPRTFTLGEACIVIQGLVLFGAASVCKLFFEDTPYDMVNVVVYTALLAVTSVITILNILNEKQRTPKILMYIIQAVLASAMIILHSIMGRTFLVDLVFYITTDRIRLHLCVFWLSLVGAAIMIICLRIKGGVKADSATRKAFHVLASLVFMSGMLCDRQFMKLAAGVGLALLVFVEALRKSKVDPISSWLQSAFLMYSDEKDVGAFAMTPIYLFVGLSCPLVLVPDQKGVELELLSGVLSIGIGDSAASWVGSKYGANKWPDSNRTIEGTVCNILSQITTVYALYTLDILPSTALLRAGIAAFTSSFVEAKTDQVDNLILPLITILTLQSTCFI